MKAFEESALTLEDIVENTEFIKSLINRGLKYDNVLIVLKTMADTGYLHAIKQGECEAIRKREIERVWNNLDKLRRNNIY